MKAIKYLHHSQVMISCSFLYCTHNMYVILHICSWAAAVSSSPQPIFKMWWGDGSSTLNCGNVPYKKMYAVLFRRVYVLLIVFLYFYEKSWVWENQKPEQQPHQNKKNKPTRNGCVLLKFLTYGHIAKQTYLLRHTKKWHYDIYSIVEEKHSELPHCLSY